MKSQREAVYSFLFCYAVVINQVFPNIGRFLRYVLKSEHLSQEAESLRTRYDTLLGKLERMASPLKDTPQQPRPMSFTGDDSKLLHLQSKYYHNVLYINDSILTILIKMKFNPVGVIRSSYKIICP